MTWEEIAKKLLECEARHLLKFMSLKERQEYLKAKPVEGRRKALEAELRHQFEEARK